MILTHENYFSTEAQQEYLSVSQYKNFCGTMGQVGCEAMAMSVIWGGWMTEMTTALLVGSYVDAHFDGSLNLFKAKNPEIFKKNGDLRAVYHEANEIINRIERDPYFMLYLRGEKQRIFTGELFGAKWKCKIDSLDEVCITDLKIMKSLRDSFWVKDYGHMSFVEYWGYNIQGAVYQQLVKQNLNKTLPFFLAVASKEKFPDIEIIGFHQEDLDDTLSLVEPNVKRILQLKNNEVVPDRCERCDFCKHTKRLSRPIHFSNLTMKV